MDNGRANEQRTDEGRTNGPTNKLSARTYKRHNEGTNERTNRRTEERKKGRTDESFKPKLPVPIALRLLPPLTWH
ncbi:hypothetical protein DPMN_160359 [Dreissena polymorpha]|uniref:Uncharacterized protein n=1 Tax=Dreissena polymorpha TaxID=45954 RepID=A0A9D4EN15_DREPO|nr:hypothetical protein DPMN_160359 [Dreissena polymorpha]